MRPRNLTPPLKCDRRGYAFVEHASIPNGSHRLSLGKYGTPDASARYQRYLERLRIGSEEVTDPRPAKLTGFETIDELVPIWKAYAEKRYLRGAELSREFASMEEAVAELVAYAGHEYVMAFGPAKLLKVRDSMAASGRLSRRTVNARLSRIKRFWKWACAAELCDPTLHVKLEAVPGLRNGEAGLMDNEEVQAACLRSFNALLPFCPPVIQDMMRVQFFCVMRPQDVCSMHRDGLDTSGDIWLYRPFTHKTQWRGKKLVKAVPKIAQEFLVHRLETETGYLFDPEEARAWGREQARKTRGERKTKLFRCEQKRLEAKKSNRRCSGCYSVGGYRTAIARATERAHEAKVPVIPFSPNQIRHAAVTWIDENVVHPDAAQKLAGHDKATTTDIYKTRRPERLIELAQAVDAAFSGK